MTLAFNAGHGGCDGSMRIDEQHALLDRFQRHLANDTTDFARSSLRVPAKHYTDDAQTAAEVDALFLRRPLLVAMSADLPKPGDYLCHDLLETPLILVRGADNEIRAFINACRHRGARIAEGRGTAASFMCPYHAWNYSLDGNVRSRPNACGGFDDAGDDFGRLAEVACHEVAGLVFVLMQGDDIESQIRATMGPAIDEIATYPLASCEYFDGREGVQPCNYKFIVDGFAEAYHIAALHKDTIRPYFYATPALTDTLGSVARMIGVRRSVDKEFDKPAAERRLLPHGTTQYLFAPNVVLSWQGDHMECWRVYPVQGKADECRMVVDHYWPGPFDDEVSRKAEFNLNLLWDVTTGEDMVQSRAIHRNLASGAAPDMVFGRNEPALIHYHKQIAQAIGSDKLTELG